MGIILRKRIKKTEGNQQNLFKARRVYKKMKRKNQFQAARWKRMK